MINNKEVYKLQREMEAVKTHNHNEEYARKTHRHDVSEIDNMPPPSSGGDGIDYIETFEELKAAVAAGETIFNIKPRAKILVTEYLNMNDVTRIKGNNSTFDFHKDLDKGLNISPNRDAFYPMITDITFTSTGSSGNKYYIENPSSGDIYKYCVRISPGIRNGYIMRDCRFVNILGKHGLLCHSGIYSNPISHCTFDRAGAYTQSSLYAKIRNCTFYYGYFYTTGSQQTELIGCECAFSKIYFHGTNLYPLVTDCNLAFTNLYYGGSSSGIRGCVISNTKFSYGMIYTGSSYLNEDGTDLRLLNCNSASISDGILVYLGDLRNAYMEHIFEPPMEKVPATDFCEKNSIFEAIDCNMDIRVSSKMSFKEASFINCNKPKCGGKAILSLELIGRGSGNLIVTNSQVMLIENGKYAPGTLVLDKIIATDADLKIGLSRGICKNVESTGSKLFGYPDDCVNISDKLMLKNTDLYCKFNAKDFCDVLINDLYIPSRMAKEMLFYTNESTNKKMIGDIFELAPSITDKEEKRLYPDGGIILKNNPTKLRSCSDESIILDIVKGHTIYNKINSLVTENPIVTINDKRYCEVSVGGQNHYLIGTVPINEDESRMSMKIAVNTSSSTAVNCRIFYTTFDKDGVQRDSKYVSLITLNSSDKEVYNADFNMLPGVDTVYIGNFREMFSSYVTTIKFYFVAAAPSGTTIKCRMNLDDTVIAGNYLASDIKTWPEEFTTISGPMSTNGVINLKAYNAEKKITNTMRLNTGLTHGLKSKFINNNKVCDTVSYNYNTDSYELTKFFTDEVNFTPLSAPVVVPITDITYNNGASKFKAPLHNTESNDKNIYLEIDQNLSEMEFSYYKLQERIQ